MTVEEHLLRLVQIGPRVTPARRREAHHEHRHLDGHAGQDHARRPEVDLGLIAQRVVLGDHHLHQRHIHPAAHLRHITAHRRLTHLRAVLVDQTLPHPPRRVPLLARRRTISRQPPVDRRLPPIQRRRRTHRPLPLRRDRRSQRLAHITTMHMEPARQLPHRQLLAVMSLADLLVQRHLRPLGHRPRSTAQQPHRWTPTSGAKPDEHYPPKWGQIR